MGEQGHISSNRKGSFRYLIIGHDYSERPLSSGIADGPGDDLFISHGNLVGQGWSGNAIGLEVARS
ncbi:MAG: hypothetical protein KAW09_04825, partial [Thermoplasmata archaeon]|nr:hypothetical protein [Thermoplasmata archaeon]